MQVKHILAQPVSSRPAIGAQEASMLVWALAVLHELTPSIWTALLDAIAAAPSKSLDKVHRLSHLCCIAKEYIKPNAVPLSRCSVGLRRKGSLQLGAFVPREERCDLACLAMLTPILSHAAGDAGASLSSWHVC